MTTNVEISLSGRYYKTRHKVMGLFNTLMTGWATAPVAQMCLHEMDWLGHQWPTELPISNLVVPLVVGGTSYLTVSYQNLLYTVLYIYYGRGFEFTLHSAVNLL
uniref:Uncharacterized protein n=1 Tax=Cacopsylla melanoneura TaxID=428564 RepID=A0A8D9A8F6_9HEMI